jgi:hypothetical protein
MNIQEMQRQLRKAIYDSKTRLVSEYKLDLGLSPEQQVQRLIETESDLLAEEVNRVIYNWLDKLEKKFDSEIRRLESKIINR